MERSALIEVLEFHGFVAATEEADELLAAAAGDEDVLRAMLERRLTGEPLAWITGTAPFCGLWIRVDPGVYVPRWQTERLAELAVSRLPEDGVAIDVCCGSGAIAAVLGRDRPRARVVGADVDPASVANAHANGVDAYVGDLYAPLPAELRGRADVVVSVVPYVPTHELALLQRDTLAFEAERSYHGGADGLDLMRRVASGARDWLRPGGALLLELGGEQATAFRPELTTLGYTDLVVLRDEDGDPRGIEATAAA